MIGSGVVGHISRYSVGGTATEVSDHRSTRAHLGGSPVSQGPEEPRKATAWLSVLYQALVFPTHGAVLADVETDTRYPVVCLA